VIHYSILSFYLALLPFKTENRVELCSFSGLSTYAGNPDDTLLLCAQLEKMRSENALLATDDSVGPDFEGLQREQMYLEKVKLSHPATGLAHGAAITHSIIDVKFSPQVSEELGNMSSVYSDSSRSGNSVERVLALELELAESLQAKAKKKSGIQFQR